MATYGAGTWTTRKADIQNCEAFENWCRRKILRISWLEKRTKASTPQQLKITTSLVNTIRRNKLIYFGHIMRSNKQIKSIIINDNSNGRQTEERG